MLPMKKLKGSWSAATLAIAMALFAAPMSSIAQDEGRTRVIVAAKAGKMAAVRTAVNAAGGRVKVDLADVNAVAIDLPLRALAALKRNGNIDFVEVDPIRRPLAPTSPSAPPYEAGQLEPYGIRMVQADQLPSGDSLAGNRKVCIIDSGYDLAHEDLSGNPVTGDSDPLGAGDWFSDENSHGTHVAGTVAAMNQAGVGVVGVAPNSTLNLHIVKVFGADGWAYSSTLSNAAMKCRKAGANVISMSLGGPRRSRIEEIVFNFLTKRGILSIAAAGNDGNTAFSYPASYPTVMSVGALDETKAWATFSQFNSEVDISAPGVNVLSSVPMGSGAQASLNVGGVDYAPGTMDGSPVATAVAPLADFGLGDAEDPAMAGKVCLIARGNIDFATKVTNCQNSGGLGAVVYNNVPGGFLGTLGEAVTTIPSVTASDTEGAAMLGQLGQQATVSVVATNYEFFNGTSMATPHVAAVAALVWSYFPSCTVDDMKTALTSSAEDLGDAGRDDKFGAGLVQAKAAHDWLDTNGCGL
jgi:subtilisin family serine protease